MSVAGLIGEAKRAGRSHLTEVESAQLLGEAGVSALETELASSAEEAAAIGARLGFPVVLKVVCSPPISKLASGGVRLNIADAVEVRAAYDQILSSVQQNGPGSAILGVAVQRMMRPGVAVMVRLERDTLFGPALSFGLGRMAVEVWEDVAYRVVPLTKVDAQRMIREVKGYRLLEGYRGWEPANIPLLEDTLLKLSTLAQQVPELGEVELSPIYAYKDAVVVLDARIALKV